MWGTRRIVPGVGHQWRRGRSFSHLFGLGVCDSGFLKKLDVARRRRRLLTTERIQQKLQGRQLKKETKTKSKIYQSNLSKSKVCSSDSDYSFGSRSFFRAGGATDRTGTAGIGSSAPTEGPSGVDSDEASESLLRERLRVSGSLDSGAPSSSSIGTVDSDSSSSSLRKE